MPDVFGLIIRNEGELKGKVALIERGGSSLYAKALALQRAGALGVIVSNNDKDHPNFIGTAQLTVTGGGWAQIGPDGLSFEPEAGLPTAMLKTVDGEPLKLTSGKWYYEVTILPGRRHSESVGSGGSGGDGDGDGGGMALFPSPASCTKIGWADENVTMARNSGVGDDAHSWGIDGDRVQAWHGCESNAFGQAWTTGAVIGCMADLDKKTLSFSLNGSIAEPMGVAFQDIAITEGLRPALTASAGSFKCNFGDDAVRPLAHLPDDYKPVASRDDEKISTVSALRSRFVGDAFGWVVGREGGGMLPPTLDPLCRGPAKEDNANGVGNDESGGRSDSGDGVGGDAGGVGSDGGRSDGGGGESGGGIGSAGGIGSNGPQRKPVVDIPVLLVSYSDGVRAKSLGVGTQVTIPGRSMRVMLFEFPGFLH